jgi:hypothetical protein
LTVRSREGLLLMTATLSKTLTPGKMGCGLKGFREQAEMSEKVPSIAEHCVEGDPSNWFYMR